MPFSRAAVCVPVTVEAVNHLVVVDMATCTFRKSPDLRSVALLAQSGELLAVVDDCGGKSHKALACQAFDTALASGRVTRDGVVCAIALYNPATREVAVGELPETVAYGDGERIAIPPRGLRLSLRPSGDAVMAGGRTLRRREYGSFAQLSRAHAAHVAPI